MRDVKKRAKWLIGIAVAIGIAAFYAYSVFKPLSAEVIVVKPKTIAQTFKEQGTVVASEERNVYSKINGNVSKLYVKEGQQLQKGDRLATIDTRNIRYQIEQLQAQRESLLGQEKMSKEDIKQLIGQLKGQLMSIEGQQQQTEKQPYNAQIAAQQLVIEELSRKFKVATADFLTQQQLFADGLVSQRELQTAGDLVQSLNNEYKQAQQSLELLYEQAQPVAGTEQYFSGLKESLQTQIDSLNEKLITNDGGSKQYFHGMLQSIDAQIEQLRDAMGEASITAPIDGTLQQLHIAEGETISTQIPLFTITSTENTEIEVYVLTEDILYVKEGTSVSLTQKRRNGDIQFTGVVQSIAASAEKKISALGIEEQRVKVVIMPQDEPVKLRPGYAIDVEFTILQQHNQFVVPKAVLFPYNNGDALFIVKNGKAVIRQVTTGLETNNDIVITKGLQVGDQVIDNPQAEGLKEGKKIKVENKVK